MMMNPSRARIVRRATAAFFGYFALGCAVIFSLFPTAWMFVSSLKPPAETFTLPPTFRVYEPTLSNYRRVLFETNIPRTFLNSVFISTVTTICVVLIAVFAAYGFARLALKGGKALSTGLLFGQMMPAVVLLIPLFRMYARIGILDSYEVSIISNTAVNMPMAVLAMTAFFRSVPRELDDASMIDGCNRIQALFRIILPVSMAGLVTVIIFTFLNTWEEFLFALNFVNSTRFRAVSVALREFRGQFIIDWGGMMSAAMVVALPVLLVFLLCNKYFIRGITQGSVKG